MNIGEDASAPLKKKRRAKREDRSGSVGKNRAHRRRRASDSRKDSSEHADSPAKADSAKTSSRKITRLRLWLFRFTAVIIVPALFLLLFEGGLRIFGYGHSMDFARRQTVNGRERILSNGHFPERFFTPTTLREGQPFALPAKKAPNTYRVFVMGGSAAFGDPEPGCGMARVLDAMLRARYPGVRFEVVNAAISAISSHVVLPIAHDCARLDGDLFIIYLGNNEVTGPYGAATVFTNKGSNLFLIRTRIALKSTRLAQLIENGSHRLGIGNDSPVALHKMDLYEANRVRASDPRMLKVYHNFQTNLEDVLGAAHKSNTSVIVSTVAVNLRDFAPLFSLHRADLPPDDLLNWHSDYDEGLALEGKGDFGGAVEPYLKAFAIDSQFAELSFRLGRCYSELRDLANARRYYALANDMDASRFRADTKINDIIRRTAAGKADNGAHLVDTAKTFAEDSPDGIPGNEFFYDQVHLRFHGNYLVAQAFLEEIRLIAPQWMRKQEIDGSPLSEEECSRRLAYTGWDRSRITNDMLSRLKRPPYTGQSSHQTCVKGLSEEVEELRDYSFKGPRLEETLAQYRTALKDFDFHWTLHSRYASLHRTLGIDMSEVEKHSRIVIDECPGNWGEYYSLGRALLADKSFKDAEDCYNLAFSQDPNRSQALSNMAGLLLSENRDIPRAIEYARQSIKINPYNFNAYLNLGHCLQALASNKEENRRQALAEFQKVLDIAPDYTPARVAIAWVYYDQAKETADLKKDEDARILLERALAVNPDFAPAHATLAGMLSLKGDKQGAIRHLTEYLRLNPDDQAAKQMLDKLKR